MNEKEMLHLFDNVRDSYVMEAMESRRTARRSPRRLLMIAAVIALGCMLMGSGWVLLTTWDQRSEVKTAEIAREDVHLSVQVVGPRGAMLEVRIDGVDPAEESVVILQGPVTLEQKTETGWEPLMQRQEDPEPVEAQVLTDGRSEFSVWWSTVYGLLEPGTYRLCTDLLEGHAPYCAEFEITAQMESSGFRTAKELLEADWYHIRHMETVTYIPAPDMSEEDRESMETYQEENSVYQYEYWKRGENLMKLTYLDGELYMGVLYRDGVKYKLTNEDPDTRLSPIAGWEVWPDYDLNRITAWTEVLLSEEVQQLEYNKDGSLHSVTVHSSSESTSFNAQREITQVVEILSTEEKEIAEQFESQNVNFYRVFSWEEDKAAFPAVEAEFRNMDPVSVETVADVISRAKKECTVDYSQIRVYRDEGAGMWKVEFQVLYGHQGYQFIYLNDQGITQRIAEAVSVWAGEEDIPFAG